MKEFTFLGEAHNSHVGRLEKTKSIKFANYFVKVLYRFWHFNDVYNVLNETKILVLWQLARTGRNCAHNYAIKLLKVVRNLHKPDLELF